MVGLDCGIFKRGQNIVFFEEGIVLKNFLVRGPRAEQTQNIRDTDAQTANARTAAAFAGFDGDPIEETGFHDSSNEVGANEVSAPDEYDVHAIDWQDDVAGAGC